MDGKQTDELMAAASLFDGGREKGVAHSEGRGHEFRQDSRVDVRVVPVPISLSRSGGIFVRGKKSRTEEGKWIERYLLRGPEVVFSHGFLSQQQGQEFLVCDVLDLRYHDPTCLLLRGEGEGERKRRRRVQSFLLMRVRAFIRRGTRMKTNLEGCLVVPVRV